VTDEEADAIVGCISELAAVTRMMATEVGRLRADVEALKETNSSAPPLPGDDRG
jgi:hypothetical protein